MKTITTLSNYEKKLPKWDSNCKTFHRQTVQAQFRLGIVNKSSQIRIIILQVKKSWQLMKMTDIYLRYLSIH